ncbi:MULTISPECIES: hypothetical protein [Methanocorpusculum]|jgi:hypothetical protein|uniref:hypothetical protein n=1 Tax=Methanocorpusculum TaxID=2192 RepID=UPI0005B27EAF|nr:MULTISPECIES: hypothetical protein [Methanocorpusculum]MDY3202272.1 hypothetical protein [Methanocorpusculum sp.]HJJ34598.1 hypothetical protein [Methanocorpusculum sp.]
MKKIWYVFGMLIVLTGIILSAGCISTPSDTPTPVTSVPTTTPTPVPTPAEVMQGQELTVTDTGKTISIRIIQKKFGSEVEEILKKGSAANPKPAPGQYAVMLKISETYESGDEAAKVVAPYHYEIYVNGIGYPAVSAALPNGYTPLSTTNILKYAKIEGWLTYIIPQGDAKLAYEVKDEPLGFIRINY